MFFSLLFVAAVAFNGVLSEESITQISCDGSLFIGNRCIIPNVKLSDFALLKPKPVKVTDGCTEGKYYMEVFFNYVALVTLEDCSGLFDIVKIDPPPYKGGCGVNVGSEDGLRIIGGRKALACQYPWMVWVTVGLYTCGGFIVDQDDIITSAHCFNQPGGRNISLNKVQVFSGSIHKYAGVRRAVKEAFLHPDYTERYFFNDIAILKLKEAIKFDGCHSPVCIGEDINYVSNAGINCRMIGWGITSEYSDNISPNYWLNWAPETIISDKECKKEFPFAFSNGSAFCGEASGTSFCVGDTGSPLVCLDENKWFAYGIASVKRSVTCSNQSGLYTNIPFYYNWINQTMNSP